MMLARLALVGICPGGRRASPWPLRPGIWGSAGCDRNCRRSGCGYDARTSMSTTTSRSQAQVRCHAVRRLVEPAVFHDGDERSEEHTSELQSLMRSSYAVFCLKTKTKQYNHI